MDHKTKIHLSSLEMDLMNNSDWILTKNNILKKAEQLLGDVQQNIFDYTKLNLKRLPAEVTSIFPKISKGENYNGLPWRMLDYPRYFEKENIFAIRTLFWWGNFFSTTLHLSGKYKQNYSDPVIRSYEDLYKDDFYCCISDDQWHHHFEKDNYLQVKELTLKEFTDLVQVRSFIKLSCKISFAEWDNSIKLLSENFTRIANWLG
ncbi:MAG: hypothetical protein ACHQF0_14950 [Chitinophagales bacterium]